MPKKAGKKIIDLTPEARFSGGTFKLIERDSSLPVEGRIPNFIFENVIGISAQDMRSYEIVKIVNVQVTEDNISSITGLYGDKYKVGDTFQKWDCLYGAGCGCYYGDLANTLLKIKEIILHNELSKLEGVNSLDTIVNLIHDLDDKIMKCLDTSDILKEIKERINDEQGT